MTTSTTLPADRVVGPSPLRIALDGALTVRSGEYVTHGLLVTNPTDNDVAIRTTGEVIAELVDGEGRVVGIDDRWQNQPLIIFTVRPSATVRIPLVVGTVGAAPELGRVVPPGTWFLRIRLDLGDGRYVVTSDLRVTVTA